MENKINDLSFKANITTLTKIKNKSAFAQINQLFKKGTEKDSGDILYIMNSRIGESVLQLSRMKNGKYVDHSSVDIAFKNINEQIDSMSIEEFAKKLVKIFEALKSHAEATEEISAIKSEINRAKSLLETNQRISHACESSGKISISKRYEVLAAKNIERICALSEKRDAIAAKFNKKIEKLSEKYSELLKLKF